MAKLKKLFEGDCPHCESELLNKVNFDDETGEIESVFIVTKAGKKVQDSDPKTDPKGDPKTDPKADPKADPKPKFKFFA